MSLKSAGWIVSLLFLIACNSNNATLPDADFFASEGQAFLIRVGDTAGVATQATIALVLLNGVANDSRCPVNVTCVTAGHATVVLTVQTALNVQEVQVEVPPQGGAQVTVEELTLNIAELRPAAVDGQTIGQLDYQLILTVRTTGSLPLP